VLPDLLGDFVQHCWTYAAQLQLKEIGSMAEERRISLRSKKLIKSKDVRLH